MEEYQRILVVTRLTRYCREAVQQGVSLAKKYQAHLFVLHTAHNPFSYKGWNLPVASLEEEYRRTIEQERENLDRIIKNEQSQGLPVEILTRKEDPTQAVLEVVKEKDVDLIVMLAHEEGRLEHFLFGRSNEELIRRMPCSILMVKKEPGPAGF